MRIQFEPFGSLIIIWVSFTFLNRARAPRIPARAERLHRLGVA